MIILEKGAIAPSTASTLSMSRYYNKSFKVNNKHRTKSETIIYIIGNVSRSQLNAYTIINFC